jgi:UDP:flavonoid glycosyltransferase YjiC (YdhE family)
MIIAIAVHGTRGDIEPCAAAALELRRRGHKVRMAVPPNLVAFVEELGLSPAMSYGVDSQKQLEADIFRKFWTVRNPVTVLRESREYATEGWAEMSTASAEMAAGADLLLTGTTYQEVAANVAEYHRIPLAALHYFPHRANRTVVPVPLPSKLVQSGFAAGEWVHWQVMRKAEDAQRRELGLSKTSVRAIRRQIEGGALEIQAYDRLLFPGLADEWAGVRPFVGALTLARATPTDDDVLTWISEGTPPIYFGWGSMPVENPAEAVTMITDVCAELGERALISSGAWQLDAIPPADHVKVVGAVNHSTVFPLCRMVAHHGGAGTTAAGMRAGVPTLALWVGADQPFFANQIKKLKIGAAQKFSNTNRENLRTALQQALAPDVVSRARELAAQLTPVADSVSTTADLLEEAARRGRIR